MQDLKKYGAIGGAIALTLIWPLAVGHIGQKVVEDAVVHLNNESVKSEIVEYDRSYLSSVVKTRYTVVDPVFADQLAMDGLPTEIVVTSDISHGLVSLSAVSTVDDMDDFPLTLETVTQLNGNTRYTMMLDSYNQVSEGAEGAIISVSPSTLSGDVTVLGDISYTLDVPSIEVDFNTGEKMVLNKLAGEGAGKKMNSFWIGEQTLTFDKFAVEDVNQQVLASMATGRYLFNSQIDEIDSTLSSQHRMSMEQIIYPEGVLDKLDVDLAFGGLDSVAFDQLVSLYQSSPMLTNEDIQTAIPLIDTLFSKGFYLAMNNMALTIGHDGKFESKWRLDVPQGTDNVSQDPMMILPALTGNLESFFSNELVEQYPFIKQGIDEAIVMEMVKPTEAGYQIQAELTEGNLVFENGQKIPLMALLMPALM